jgi:hypothetical protein
MRAFFFVGTGAFHPCAVGAHAALGAQMQAEKRAREVISPSRGAEI